MSRKALDWAQRLRGELVERIEALRIVLADIAPLQAELSRLEAQLEGVDRLIAVYVSQLGLSAVDASNGAAAHDVLVQPHVEAAPLTSRDNAQLGEAARILASALRYETLRLLSRCGKQLQAAWIAGRLRVMMTLHRLSGER